jgi:mono/diheme cytochrome c family protein
MNHRLILCTAAAAAATLLASFTLMPRRAPAGDPVDPVARGKYLVTTMVCNDCHTPWTMTANGPGPDMTRMLSGHPADLKLPAPPAATDAWPTIASASMTAWSGPWGISYTANLTPDRETGLGAWTADEFVQTLRTGRHQGRGREILPPMPWPFIGQLTDDDLRAMFAYLQSVPAVKNKVPTPEPPQGK